MRDLPLGKIQSLLLESILERRSVQELFDRLYALVALPMICFDPSFSLIAYAFSRPFYFSHWEWIVQEGAARPADIMAYGYFSNQERMIDRGSAAVYSDGTCLGYDQACGPIFISGQVAGYCGLMVEDAVPEQVVTVTDMLIQAVAAMLRQGPEKEQQLRELLLAQSLSPAQAAGLSELCGGNYVFAVFSCEESRRSTLQYVKVSLESQGPRFTGCLNGDGLLYMLCGGLELRPGLPPRPEDLEAIARHYGLTVGCSDWFSRPEELPDHREQALLALYTGLRTGKKAGICAFEEMYRTLLCQAAIEYYGPEACVMGEISLLAQKDASQDTEYIRTLEVWLDSMRRKSLTGERLGQHKATVAHRLERIGELIGADPVDLGNDLQMGLDMARTLRPSGQERGGLSAYG